MVVPPRNNRGRGKVQSNPEKEDPHWPEPHPGKFHPRGRGWTENQGLGYVYILAVGINHILFILGYPTKPVVSIPLHDNSFQKL
jgi:hypothetical protein